MAQFNILPVPALIIYVLCTMINNKYWKTSRLIDFETLWFVRKVFNLLHQQNETSDR